ncbi:MAG: adenylosuccinate lyase, partial [Bacteroidota bacterium]
SSAMPHKRNPITCERIAGLARVLRGNALAALEDISLWHERDISHSSVERVIVPDSCILLDYMLSLTIDLLDKLLVYPEHMLRNIGRTHGLIFSQSVLLALTKKGMKREDAYRIVQSAAMQVWEADTEFKEILLKNPDVLAVLSPGEIEELFDLKKSIRNVDYIFHRAGLSS